MTDVMQIVQQPVTKGQAKRENIVESMTATIVAAGAIFLFLVIAGIAAKNGSYDLSLMAIGALLGTVLAFVHEVRGLAYAIHPDDCR